MTRLALVHAALLALLAGTVALSSLPLGLISAVGSFVIAAIKAALVMWFFMELRRGRALNRLVLAVAVLTLGLLLLAGSDYLTRAWTAAGWESPATADRPTS
jgi:cytochrome c oxidase subunit 4